MPELQSLPPGETMVPFRVEPGGMSFDVYDVVTQRFSSQHFDFVDGRVEAYPVEFRYAWPAELDLMARLAGLTCGTAGQGGSASRSLRSAPATSLSTRSPEARAWPPWFEREHARRAPITHAPHPTTRRCFVPYGHGLALDAGVRRSIRDVTALPGCPLRRTGRH